MIDSLLSLFCDRKTLDQNLIRVSERHYQIGILSSHLAILAEGVIRAFRVCLGSFDEDIHEAWRKIYSYALGVMVPVIRRAESWDKLNSGVRDFFRGSLSAKIERRGTHSSGSASAKSDIHSDLDIGRRTETPETADDSTHNGGTASSRGSVSSQQPAASFSLASSVAMASASVAIAGGNIYQNQKPTGAKPYNCGRVSVDDSATTSGTKYSTASAKNMCKKKTIAALKKERFDHFGKNEPRDFDGLFYEDNPIAPMPVRFESNGSVEDIIRVPFTESDQKLSPRINRRRESAPGRMRAPGLSGRSLMKPTTCS